MGILFVVGSEECVKLLAVEDSRVDLTNVKRVKIRVTGEDVVAQYLLTQKLNEIT
jgi:hypothetical protein